MNFPDQELTVFACEPQYMKWHVHGNPIRVQPASVQIDLPGTPEERLALADDLPRNLQLQIEIRLAVVNALRPILEKEIARFYEKDAV